jgi:acyl-CoA dehydrogenase
MATSSGLSFEISETQKELQKMARDFTLDIILPQAPIYDENMKFPQDIFTKAWELGLINTRIPEAYGGLGLSCT